MWDKVRISDRGGFSSLINVSGNYRFAHGANLASFFAPFTTNTFTSGDLVIPSYEVNLWVSGGNNELNPFGIYSIERGLLYGSGIPEDINDSIDPSSVRTFGFRGPMHLVGAGYDQFGFPTPNYVTEWNVSGVFSTASGVPSSSGFLGQNLEPTDRLANVPDWFDRAGPVDMRWDVNRKVWTSPQSVYSARVRDTIVVGGGDPAQPQFPENVTYDAEIVSGPAQVLFITGVVPLTSRRPPNTIQIQPLVSGDHCLIIHTISSSGMPGYGVFCIEKDAVQSCDEEESTPQFRQSSLLFSTTDLLPMPEDFEGSIRWALSSSDVSGSPLEYNYGGTSFDDYNPGDLLLGNISGGLSKVQPIGVSGILTSYTDSEIVFSLDPTFDFTTMATGVNDSITELQGLTTPLSVNQGGTGSSSLSFVTTAATGQLINGIKQFQIGAVFVSGSVTAPQLRFGNGGSNWGLWYKSTPQEHLALVVSGTNKFYLNTSGSFFDQSSLSIAPKDNHNSLASLVIQRADIDTSGFSIDIVQINSAYNLDNFITVNTSGQMNFYQPSGMVTDFFNLYDEDDNLVGFINASGKIVSRFREFDLGISGQVATLSTQNLTSNRVLNLPDEDGTLATTNLMITGYTGNIEVVDSLDAVSTLVFVSGILTEVQ
jgi:hypothetical protein